MAHCHYTTQYINQVCPMTHLSSSPNLTYCTSNNDQIYLENIQQQLSTQLEPTIITTTTTTSTNLTDHDLSSYLDNCKSDFDATLHSFAQFADEIEASNQTDQQYINRLQSTQIQPSSHKALYPTPPLSLSPETSIYEDCLFEQSSIQRSSAMTTGHTTPTLMSSTRTTANSSPCCWPLSPASSGRSSASVSDGSASGYSGLNESNHNDDLDLDNCDIRSRSRRSHHHRHHHHYHDKRQKNASAAGKYRRRLKGRQRVIHVEMELEEARNRQLRRQLDSKLALYCEFVDLLADNTKAEDFHLASKGLESLGSILSELKDQHDGYGSHEQAAYELHEKFAKFQAILKMKQQQLS